MAGKLSKLAGHTCLTPSFKSCRPLGVNVFASVRTLARRALKPAAMALIAGTLALSLTVTTTQKAEASPGIAVAPVIAAAEGVLAGGVRLALPSLLSIAIATTPVGWVVAGGLAIGALGVGLYSTRDYWVPFVAGTFGAAVDSTAPTDNPAPASLVTHNMTVSAPSIGPSGRQGRYSYVLHENFPVATTFRIDSTTFCADSTGKATTPVYYDMGGQYLANQGAGIVSTTNTQSCPVGQTMTGFIVGPARGHALLSQQATGTRGPKNVITWGKMPGAPPSDPGFNPMGGDVKYKTTAECIDAGGNKTSITAEWFGDEGGAKVPSCAAAGKGHGTGKMSIEGYAPTAPGVPGTQPQTVWGVEAPTSDPDHPLCGPQRADDGCKMAITIDGKPCVVGVWECENWADIYNDPTTAPRVGCTYGPYAMAVDLCRIMEPAYRPGGAPATEENMDADPATRNYTNPGGTTYAPPATGTGVVPGVGGQPQPGTDPESAECFPSGWAMLNPVEWVLQPIRCAFTPSQSTATNLTQRINTKISTVGFAPVATAWGDAFQSVGGGSGCAGPTVNFSMNGVHQQFQPFNACSGVMAQAAGISTAVLSLGVIFFGGLGIVRAIGSAFGFNFSMGGKSDGD